MMSNYTIREIVICPKCKGEGKIRFVNSIYERFKIACTNCNGKGRVVQIKKVSYEKL